MKDRSSIFRRALAALTATAVCLGAPWSIARAQNTPNDSPAPPPAANPGGPFQQPPRGAPAPGLPYGAGEVIKMYQGGINKDVILNYINSTAGSYHLSADGIIYLQGLGLPQEITKAMIQRDGQLQQQQMANQQYYQSQPTPGAAPPPYGYGYGGDAGQPPVQIATPTTPAPAVVVDYAAYPYYDYGYPYYYAGWPYYYGGYGVIGGWGWGWGRGGYRGGYYGGYRGGVGGFHGGVGVGGFHGGVGVGVGGFHAGGGGGFRGSAGGHGGGFGGGGHGGGGGHR